MKLKFIVPLLLLYGYNASAQLSITQGLPFSVFNDTKLTLKNMDLINNGNLLLATTNPVSFTGDLSSVIGGDQATRFFKIEINKTSNQSVILQRIINVGSSVIFTSGFLNLNGNNLDLETTGTLVGENRNSRVLGANGGQVFLTTGLNAPTNANPGNLGLVITSNQDLGQVVIKRGHQAQQGTALPTSLLRYYEITQQNNAVVAADLRFNYFDEELNGLTENALTYFKSGNTVDWSDIGFSVRDTQSNFVEKNNVSPFSRFTLSSAVNTVLSVHFSRFAVSCDAGKAIVKWSTSEEQNTKKFSIERSTDALHWIVVGALPAAGNSTAEMNYAFTDNSPVSNAYYRIAEEDIDGSVHYTDTVQPSCTLQSHFKVWPNPVQGKLFITITTGNRAKAYLSLYDSKGSLMKKTSVDLSSGTNQFELNMSSMPSGVYFLNADWNNQKMVTQITKQ